MFEKLLKAISLNDEDYTEETEDTDYKGHFFTILILAVIFISIVAAGYFYMMNCTKYKYDDSMTVSQNGTRIVYDNDGAYLMKGKRILSDVYRAIEKDPFSDYCRVIDNEGLIGFISKTDGKVVIKPKYTDASPMSDHSSCVSEGNGFYFISEDGSYMTGTYEEANPLERNGTVARVKTSEGWAIIDKNGTVLIDKCESIGKLPFIASTGMAVRNGHVLLLRYSNESDETASVQVIKEFEEFSEISGGYLEEFVVVKGKNGFGAIDFNGNIIMPAVYESLDWDSYKIQGEVFKKEIIFKGKKKNGRFNVMDWNPEKA